MSQPTLLKTFSEMDGKTVLKATKHKARDDKLMVQFTDGTAINIGIDPGYDPGDEALAVDATELSLDELYGFGLIEIGEYRARLNEQNAAREVVKEREERQVYERLKKKFEQGDTA